MGLGVVELATDLFLTLLLAVALIGGNRLVSVATAILLILRLLHVNWLFPYIEEAGIRVGLTILVLSVLAPLVAGDLPPRCLTRLLTSPTGLAAIIGGVAGALLGAQGLSMLESYPESILGLVFGTIIGATFLQGIPVGPLVAAGLTALLLRLLGCRL